MHDQVMRFIGRFTQNGQNNGVIETFSHGCCYWFAIILFERFFEPDSWRQDIYLMYDQVANHFGCRIEGIVYDITGDVTDKYDWETWISVADADDFLYDRIFRDCINF